MTTTPSPELPDLDKNYVGRKLAMIVRDLSHYTAQEMARELVRLAKAADESEAVKEDRRAQPEGEAPQAVPLEAIGKLVSEAMDVAVKNGASSVSMPNEYVAVSHFVAHPEQYGFAPAAEHVKAQQAERKGWGPGTTYEVVKAAQQAESGAQAAPHWYDGEQTALGGKSAREGYAANPAYAHLQPAAKWLPTPENVNALPEGVRQYVHALEARCDPAGDVAALTGLRDQLDGVQLMYRAAADERDRLAAQSQGAQATVKGRSVYQWYVTYCETSEKLKAANGCIERYAAALAAKAEAPARVIADTPSAVSRVKGMIAAQQAAAPGALEGRGVRPLCRECNGRGLIGLLTSLRCNACSGTGRVAAPSAPGTPEAPAIKKWEDRAYEELGSSYPRFKCEDYMLAEIADWRAAQLDTAPEAPKGGAA